MVVRRHLRSETGESLVEVLVALVILSIAAVAILAGVQLSVQASDIHRKQTTSGAYVRSYAEAIEKHLSETAHYVECAGPNAYNVSEVTDNLDLPPEFAEHDAATHTAAVALGPTGAPKATPCVAADDDGVQRVQLSVKSDDDRATERLTVILRRACEGPACHPTP